MSGSLGSVTLDLNVDMTQFDTGLRRAKSEVDNLIRAAERNRVRLTLDTGTINRDLSRLDAQMRSLTSGTRTVSVRADASAAIGSINDAAARAAALQNTRVTIPVTADTSAAMGALGAIQTRTREVSEGIAGIGNAGQQAFGGLAGAISPIPLGLAGVGVGVAALGVATVKFGVDAIQTFASFEEGMAQVFTLLPQMSEAAMTAMSDQALGLSEQYGVLTSDVVPALYEAISSGVPQENVFEFMGTAIEASIAGAASVTSVVDGLTSVINGYGMAASDAGRISDVMFQTVNVGKVTMDELSRTLYDVVPISASLGITFEDVSAAIAAMTSQGVPARVATTQLRSAFNELSKDGTKLSTTFETIAGTSFRNFIASGGTVAEAFNMISEYAASSGVGVNELASSVEASGAIMMLSGENAHLYADALETINNSSGSTARGVETMNDTAQRSFQKLGAAWERLKIEFGKAIAPQAAEWADNLSDKMPEITAEAVKAAEAISKFAEDYGPAFLETAKAIALTMADIADGAMKVYGWWQAAASVKWADIGLGFLDPDTPDTFSMEPFIVAAEAATEKAAQLEAAQQDITQSQWELEGAAINAARAVEEESAAMEAAASNGFVEWLGTRIPAAGEAALDQLDLVAQGVGAGMVTAEEAVDAFTQSGTIGFIEFREAAQGELDLLSDALQEARLAPPTEESAASIAAISAAMDVYKDIIAEATAEQDKFNQASQNWNGVQGAFDAGVTTASNNMSQWQSDISEAEKALGILDQQLADGTITQEEYNTTQGELNQYLERTQGGLEDQNDAYIDGVLAKSEFMRKQDELNSALASGQITQEEYNGAIAQAEEVMAGAAGPMDTLVSSMDKVVQRLEDVLIGLGILPPRTEAEVVVTTTEAEENITTVDQGFTEFDGKRAMGTVEVNADDAQSDLDDVQGEADDFTNGGPYAADMEAHSDAAEANIARTAEQAQKYAAAEYLASLTVDELQALQGIGDAQSGANAYVDNGPYLSALNITDNASGPIDSVQSDLWQLTGQTYLVTVDANVAPAIAAIAQLGNNLPSSPAKEGPLSYTPSFDYVFEAFADSSDAHLPGIASEIASYMPMNSPAEQGALASVPDWSFLFSDLDTTAEDYASNAADAFVSFFAGNLEEIANGEAMYEAQQALEESLMIREIAVDAGMGADVIAEIDARIQEQRDAIAAIGAVVGSGIVDGLIEEVQQFDIGDALRLPDGSSPWSLDDIVSGDALADAEAAIAEMMSLLAIAMESGDQELIDLYTGQLAELERQLAVLHEILGTQTVADLQAAADAAAAAEQNTADLIDRFMQIGADPTGSVNAAYEAVEELRRALELAILTPGTPMDVINDLLVAYQAAQVTAAQMAADAAKMFQAGLIDADELQAMAEAGGQAFIDGFNAVMGDPNAYANIVQAQEDALDEMRQVQLDQLALMIEDAEDGGVSILESLIESIAAGETDFEDALAIFTQIAEQNGQGLQETLGALYLSLQEDLQKALALGTDTAIIEQNIAVIRELLASLGLEIDDVLAAAAAAANTAATVATSKGLQGGSGPGGRNYAPNGYERDGRNGFRKIADDAEDAAVNIDALLKAIADMQDGGVSIIDELVESAAKGTAKYDDLLGTLATMTAEHSDDMQDALADMFVSVQDALAEAIASGAAQDVIAPYERQLDILKRVIADMGWQVDDLLSQAEDAEARLRASTGGGGSGATLTLGQPTIVNNFNPRISPRLIVDGNDLTSVVGNNLVRKVGVGN